MAAAMVSPLATTMGIYLPIIACQSGNLTLSQGIEPRHAMSILVAPSLACIQSRNNIDS